MSTTESQLVRGYLSNKMVVERCERHWRHNQWRQLHALALQEPRARAWTMERIARLGNLTLVDVKVRELHDALKSRPPAPVAAPGPLAPAAGEIVVELVPMTTQPGVVWEDVDMASMEIRPRVDESGVMGDGLSIEFTVELEPTELPREFVTLRAAGKPVMAGEELLRQLHQLPPGTNVPLRPVEFRELAAQLAEAGEFKLLVDLCGRLPGRVTGVAMMDLAEMLRTGARLREPLEWYEEAAREVRSDDERGQRSLDQMLLAAVKSAAHH